MDDDSSLDTLLAHATNPLNRDLDIEIVKRLCEQINHEHDGSNQALRFLAHKIQSPQEREAIQALLVLEELTNRCGAKFQEEVGKFRFLNELIKVVSPKYLGNRASLRVKQKIIEMMYRWSMEMKQHSKIQEAYQMLKRQGVVSEDPVYVIENYEPPPPPVPRPKSAVFEDEEKSQMLQKLLQSKNPEDLQAANRLIKSMVKEADRRMELLARRTTELETVHNNAKVLRDMLNNYKPHETSAEEKELMKELFESCERLRPKLFRLAGEMEEKDEGLSEILTANDELTNVINIYKRAMGLEVPVNGGMADLPSRETSLLDLGSPAGLKSNHSQSTQQANSNDLSLLDDQLLALGIADSSSSKSDPKAISVSGNDTGGSSSSSLDELGQIFSGHISSSLPNSIAQAASFTIGAASSTSSLMQAGHHGFSQAPVSLGPVLTPTSTSGVQNKAVATTMNSITSNSAAAAAYVPNLKSRGFEELDALGQSLIKQALPLNATPQGDFPSNFPFSHYYSTPQKIPLNQLQKHQAAMPTKPVAGAVGGTAAGSIPGSPSMAPRPMADVTSILDMPAMASPSKSPSHEVISLADIFVPLETIQPGTLLPLTLHEKNNVTVVVHFAKNSPRPDVTVMVVSTMSKNSSPVKSVNFQAAVPKSMKIKLQPPSATDLPPHNPILPPAAITQVMLLANPNKETVRLKYKLTYNINGEMHTDIGEVDNLLEPRVS